MKRILLSLSLLGAVFFGHSQVVLNEIYVDPALQKEHNEFFELYNTSILPTPINLNCYTLVSYKWAKNGNKTLFVIDLPNQTINPKGYYVGGASNPLNVQGKVNQPLNFSWADANLASIEGSIKKYVLNDAGTGYTESAPNAAEMKDIFFTNSQGVTGYGVFLFNNGVYVNGFIGKYASATPPSEIKNLPAITGLSNICGTYALTFSDITKNEFVGSEAGTDNGYVRTGDGLCGTWVKASSQVNHTPGTANPGSTTSTAGSTLATTESLVCSNRLDFTVATPETGVAYPVEVQLYIDKNKDGRLDATDEYVSSYPTLIAGGSTTVYSFSSLAVLPSTWQYLVVYKTALGCFDKIAIPTAIDGQLNTTQVNFCGKQIDFKVTGASGNITPFVFNIIAELHYDLDGNSTVDNNNNVDENGNNIVDGEEVILQSRTITAFTANTYTFTNLEADKNYTIVYKTATSCYGKTVRVPQATGTVTTTQSSLCGKLIYNITATGDALTYSLPLEVGVYPAGLTDTAGKQVGKAIITGYTNGIATGTITLSSGNEVSNLVIVYKAAASCLSPASAPVTNTVTGTITAGGFIKQGLNANDKREATYFIVNASTAADTYPILLQLYEDTDRDGVIDADEVTIGQQTITTAPTTGTANTVYTAEMANPNSYTIVKATAIQGCSSFMLGIDNTNAILPVKFKSFTASRSSQKVSLAWETASEENNRGFHVQRNTNGEWKNIGFVFSKAERGNSSTVLSYSYNDNNSHKGISQYRLLQVDIDGKGKYSEIRSVRGEESTSKLSIFPNPSSDGKVNILFEDGTTAKDVIVSDITGRIIKQYKNIKNNNLVVDGLTDGYYTIQVINNTTAATTVEKVIIKKR